MKRALNFQSKPKAGSSGTDVERRQEHWKPIMHRVLKDTFRYDAFRGQQEAAIQAVLDGRDCFVLMPTGGGKSLCYTIPALCFDKKVVIVICPLIALMQDQVISLQQRGVAAACLSSALNESARKKLMICLENGLNAEGLADLIVSKNMAISCQHSSGLGKKNSTLKMLYVTPELLATVGFQKVLRTLNEKGQLGAVAVDEAHCISSYGHDFRPAYRQLAWLRHNLHGIPILALTATATHQVQQDILYSLQLSNPLVLQSSFNRPNITYSVHLLDVMAWDLLQAEQLDELQSQEARLMSDMDVSVLHDVDMSQLAMRVDTAAAKTLKQLLEKHLGIGTGKPLLGCGIMYVFRRTDADEMLKQLQRMPGCSNLRCAAYHAGLSDKDRKDVLDQWINKQLDFVVATIAFGMGIDRADVRLVVHGCIPKTLEGYYQESGRAGRDGNMAHAALLYAMKDRQCMEWIIQNGDKNKKRKRDDQSSPDPAKKKNEYAAFNAVVSYVSKPVCRRASLLSHFGESLPSGTCQGCDYCQDTKDVKTATTRLEILESKAQSQITSTHVSNLMSRATGAWRGAAPEGTYGMDQIQDSDEDDDEEGYRKRQEMECDIDGNQYDEDTLAASTAAAIASRAAMGSKHSGSRGTAAGDHGNADDTNMNSTAYLAVMAKLEDKHNRQQAGRSGMLAALNGGTFEGRQASSLSSPPSEIPDSFRSQQREALHKMFVNSKCTAGLPEEVIRAVVETLEAAYGRGQTNKTAYKGKLSNLVKMIKASQSLIELFTPQLVTEHMNDISFKAVLQSLLVAEMKAIQSQVTSSNLSESTVSSLAGRFSKLTAPHITSGCDTAMLAHDVMRHVQALQQCHFKSISEVAVSISKVWNDAQLQKAAVE